MKRTILLLTFATMIMSCQIERPTNVESFDAPQGGQVQITMIHHGSIALSYNGYHIFVDPVANDHGTKIDYSNFPKADLILVTHEHGDHLDPACIATLSKSDGTTFVLCNAASKSKIKNAHIASNGDSITVNGAIPVKAVPAYNTTKGHTQFHPKGNGNGYCLTLGGLHIYIAGDTEDIPELKDLRDIDIAFLPANQPYTMTVNQCISAAKTIQPKVLIPYHLGNTNMEAIRQGLEDTSIKVHLHDSLR